VDFAALIGRRGAVSAVAGLLVSTFATAALAVGTVGSVDRLALGHTISDRLAPMLSAIGGAGLAAGTIVFLCLLMNDALRRVGPWLVEQRRSLLVPLRALTWVIARGALAMVIAVQVVARSTVVVETIWLARTVGRPLGVALACVAGVAFAALMYVGTIVAGLACVRQATHIVVTILEDPPRQLAMTLGLALATSLMYIGLGAFALCGWLAYRVMRGGLQWAGRTRTAAWRR
jgi:hypothetical protein